MRLHPDPAHSLGRKLCLLFGREVGFLCKHGQQVVVEFPQLLFIKSGNCFGAELMFFELQLNLGLGLTLEGRPENRPLLFERFLSKICVRIFEHHQLVHQAFRIVGLDDRTLTVPLDC